MTRFRQGWIPLALAAAALASIGCQWFPSSRSRSSAPVRQRSSSIYGPAQAAGNVYLPATDDTLLSDAREPTQLGDAQASPLEDAASDPFEVRDPNFPQQREPSTTTNNSPPFTTEQTERPAERTIAEIVANWKELGASVEIDENSHVTTIDASNSAISNSHLRELHQFTRLQHLNLRGCAIDDDGIASLAGVPSLQFLGLSETRLSDNGLLPLRKLTQLRFLSLAGTYVTDNAIPILIEINGLEGLNLSNTGVSHDGVKVLREYAPNCEVVWEPKSQESSRLFHRDATQRGVTTAGFIAPGGMPSQDPGTRPS
ncbi:MAG: hypothetical protein R3B90_03035 [Planctomycetaceae bacterium]